MNYKQYSIAVVNLDPVVGAEINKTRPCLIISPNEMNENLDTINVAPITSSNKNYPTRVKITGDNPNDVSGYVAIDQIRTIDKHRITKVLNPISEKEIKEVKRIFKETFVD